MKNNDSSTTLNIKIKVQSNLPSYVNAFITTYNIVQKNTRKKQPLLTSLQTELLFLYADEPTEKQMKHFQVFRFYLLSNDYYNFKSKQEIEEYNLLPKKKLAVKRDQLSSFQNELLSVYDHEPTEEQMLKLKEFLFKLFNNLLNKFDDKKEEKMAA